jgi:hypothetical protein
MSRLSRKNSLIEDNLYPMAGCHRDEVEKKFVEILTPFENDILQFESALLLHNIPLFVVYALFFVGFLVVSLLATKCFLSSLTYAFIVIPIFTLVYNLGGVSFGRSLYKPLPELPEDNQRRIRPLAELVGWTAPALLWG